MQTITAKMPKNCLATVIVALCFSAAAAFAAEPNRVTVQPQALDYAGIYKLRQLDPNLTGAGTNIAAVCRSNTYINGEPQNDYRFNVEHSSFKNKTVTFYDWGDTEAGTSPHSTSSVAILVGEDANGFHPDVGKFYYEGATPKASINLYEFWYFVSNNVFTNDAAGSDVVTMSIGNQFEEWWTRGLEALAEWQGVMIVAGIGNGSSVYDPVLYPAAGSNALGVGVVDPVKSNSTYDSLANFALPSSEHSSKGPTPDGRCKPDIIAPGNCLVPSNNDVNGYEVTGSWSSFSTPVVAGAAALLLQKAKSDPNLSPALPEAGGSPVLKAILMNSASKLPYWHKGLPGKQDDHQVPLDFVQGAGLLNAAGAYKILVAGPNEPGDAGAIGWDNNLLDASNGTIENSYRINLPDPAGKFITATLVWNKHHAKSYPFEPLRDKDSDLRLEVWASDVNNPANDYLLDYSDSNVDNVEHIYCEADGNYTYYEIVVSFSDTNVADEANKAEQYALAWDVTQGTDKENILWYDLNGDGIVNNLDLTILTNNLSMPLLPENGYLSGDINMDGLIDLNDLQILAAHNLLKADWYEQKLLKE